MLLSQSLKLDAYQFAVVILTVSAVLDVVQIVAGLLAKQAQLLSAGHVKLLFATGFVALHAGTGCRLRTFSAIRTDVTC